MAFITILARHKTVSKFQLRGPTTLGRSMDCDIYIPDVFVSREHCRFIEQDGQWHIIDAQSRNGVWHKGRRFNSCLLKPNDLIEIGTIALRYNAGDSDAPSHPAPFGSGLSVSELMDTVYALDLRPSQYVKKQKARKAEWIERVKHKLAELDDIPMPDLPKDLEPWRPEEWAELDVELQLTAGQELMIDWEPPIFNPKRTPVAGSAPAATKPDSIDVEVGYRVAATRSAAATKAAAMPTPDEYDGIRFEQYTWRDRLRDALKDRTASMLAFSKLNPQIAAAIMIGVAVLAFASIRYSPVANRSANVYVPTDEEKRAWGLDKPIARTAIKDAAQP